MIDFLKAYFHLGSPVFVVVSFGLCAAWIAWRPASRAARWVVAVVVLAYWIAATPAGARALAGMVGGGYGPLPNAAAAEGADTIVILSGGEISYMVGGVMLPALPPEGVMRALEAARVYQMLGHGTIISTGGRVDPAVQLVPEADVLREALVRVGVPAGDIVTEDESRNTREQALAVGDLLKARGVTKFVLVTSKTHMRRSVGAFRALGFDPIPSASPIRSEQYPPAPWLLPSDEWLTLSDMAIYDMAANIYYWWEGWI